MVRIPVSGLGFYASAVAQSVEVEGKTHRDCEQKNSANCKKSVPSVGRSTEISSMFGKY